MIGGKHETGRSKIYRAAAYHIDYCHLVLGNFCKMVRCASLHFEYVPYVVCKHFNGSHRVEKSP